MVCGSSFWGTRFALRQTLRLCIATVSLKVGVMEGPAVVAKHIFLAVLDLVKIIFVELMDKASKFGGFEHARYGKLGHILR